MSNEVANRTGRRVTSADVAREAGVSRATVSYVLNNTPHQKIPVSTALRVREAAARLRYSPSAAARTLSRGRSDVVLYLLPPHLRLNAQFGDLLEHLSAALASAGLTLVVHPWSRNLRPVTAVWSALAPVAVMAQHLEEDEIQAMNDAGVEVVHSLLTADDKVSRWVRRIQDEICDRQVAALAAAGHRQLGYAMPGDERLRDEVEFRRVGVGRACSERGLPEPVALTVPADVAGAAAAIDVWRKRTPAVTGICAYDDTTALTILAGLGNEGLSAPKDLAVIGVYDIPAARLSKPPLSTIALDAEAMANFVASTLLRSLDGKQPSRKPAPCVTTLIDRESVIIGQGVPSR